MTTALHPAFRTWQETMRDQSDDHDAALVVAGITYTDADVED